MTTRTTRRDFDRGARALYARPRYYDHAYKHRTADVAFYVRMCARFGDPVLELGAGTGRVTLGLLRAGACVTAVDRSRAMLARARERSLRLPADLRSRATWRRADVRRVRLHRRFPLVIAPFNLFMHLYTLRDVEAALATVREHLTPGGHFVMDVLTPDLGALRRDPRRVYRCRPVFDPTDSARYAYGESYAYDAAAQVQTVELHFQRLDATATERRTPLTLRMYFPQELLALLRYNGFDVEERLGDFSGAPFGPESDYQILIARRARRR